MQGNRSNSRPSDGDQPVVPLLPTWLVVLGPGKVGPHIGCSGLAHACDGAYDTLMFAETEPFGETELSRTPDRAYSGHVTRPRASSCRFASSPRSRAPDASDPMHQLVEQLFQEVLRLEPEQVARLADIGEAMADIPGAGLVEQKWRNLRHAHRIGQQCSATCAIV